MQFGDFHVIKEFLLYFQYEDLSSITRAIFKLPIATVIQIVFATYTLEKNSGLYKIG